METLKKEILDAINKLPDTATLDDMMYRLYIIDKVHKGKEAVNRGETVSIEEIKKNANMVRWSAPAKTNFQNIYDKK